jgi:regulator of protease activity HflC (stomatin/prohibitin superfamily)
MIELLTLAFLAIAFLLISTSFFTVRQNTAAIVEVFGKFYAVKESGIRLKFPIPIGQVVGRISLRLQELHSQVEVKTLDNVFVSIPVSLQYRVLEDKVKNAFYSLSDPQHQIQSFVLNVIRTSASGMTLEHLYTEKSKIAEEVSHELTDRLASYGYTVEAVLIDQPLPPQEVQDAFNRVIASQRDKESAKLEGEATRIRMVATADAEKESKKLQGEGIAAQRKAIAEGFKEAVDSMKGIAKNMDESVIIATLLATNQFDTIREASTKAGNLILMPYSADSAISDIARTAAAIKVLDKRKNQD